MVIDSYENKKKILDDFLLSCLMEGVSDAVLKESVRKILGKEVLMDLVFEDGCLDLITFYVEEKNKESSKRLKEIDGFADFRMRDKIRTALNVRFEVEKQNREQLKQIFNFYINPKSFIKSGKGVKPFLRIFRDCFMIADFIWYEIGDSSTDFNFYTKRITLAKIIFRSLSVFMKDGEELSATKKIIDVEIEKVMKFEKYKAKLKGFLKNSFINEKGLVKTPKECVNELPFFRLRKKNK
ncbi:MAG: COQ9 family protein [Rickettsiales bacterium]|nr:COQ9 family protein [Rickettsiales bacterium]